MYISEICYLLILFILLCSSWIFSLCPDSFLLFFSAAAPSYISSLDSKFFERGVLFRKGLDSNMWCTRIARNGHTDTTDSPRKGKLHRSFEEVGEVQGKEFVWLLVLHITPAVVYSRGWSFGIVPRPCLVSWSAGIQCFPACFELNSKSDCKAEKGELKEVHCASEEEWMSLQGSFWQTILY